MTIPAVLAILALGLNLAAENLVANPGFQEGEPGVRPIPGWSIWSVDNAYDDAAYTESSFIYGNDGERFHLTHYRGWGFDWHVATYQLIEGLQNGRYTLRARVVKNGVGFVNAFMEAKEYGGVDRFADIPTAWEFTTIEIPDIEVTNGQCRIGFWTHVVSGSDWPFVFIDDVEFFRQEEAYHNVTFTAVGNGTVVGDLAQTVVHGGNATAVEAVADDGDIFAGWDGDYVGMDNPLTVTGVTSDLAITAVFAEGAPLVMAVDPFGTGTTVPAEGGPYTIGVDVPYPIVAVPAPGYAFAGWMSNAPATTTFGDPEAMTTTVILGSTLGATVTATFAEAPVLSMVPAVGGATVPAAGAYTVPVGVAQDIAATAAEGYGFVEWLCTDPTAIADPAAAATTVTLDGDTTVTPVFTINLYTVVFRTDGTTGATVNDAATVTFTVAHGDDCTPVAAAAPAGQAFTGWSGGRTGMDNPLTVTNVTSDLEIVANFGKWVAQGIVIDLDAAAVPDLATPGLFFVAPKFTGVYTDRLKDPAGLKPKKAGLKLLAKADKLNGTAVLPTEWTKKLRLYDAKAYKAALKAGTTTAAWLAADEANQQNLELDLQVASKEIADPNPKNRFRSVYGGLLAAPEAISAADGIADAKGNATWLITGKWFGTKAPKAYREYTVPGKAADTFVVKLQGLKIVNLTDDAYAEHRYVDIKEKPVFMDPETGESALVVLVPAAPKAGEPGDIVIDNGVGLGVIPPPASRETIEQ
jgi:hypothetical protein